MEDKYLKIISDFKTIEEELKKGFNPEISRKYKKLKPLYDRVSSLRKIEEEMAKLDSLKNDPEMCELYEEEMEKLSARAGKLKEEINHEISRSPFEGRPIIVEIRAGTGGEEAGIFAADLFRMYQKMAEKNGIKIEVFSAHATDMGGIKEIVFEAKGEKAFYFFRFEGGVHRVQRIPITESGGRIHTSAASVAVFPEPDEVEIQINPVDLRIDTFRASGKGGQHVNKTDSAVRITHIPTGIVASCQDERSQTQNKQKAMRILRSRLYEKQVAAEQKRLENVRRNQIGTADRSEKIRTYNFPQNRVTDHRIKFTIYSLSNFMDGDIATMTEKLWAELA